MIKKKIIFKNISSLVRHLNEIDENPLSWWNSNELISVEINFMSIIVITKIIKSGKIFLQI